jgi:hypothetical protein
VAARVSIPDGEVVVPNVVLYIAVRGVKKRRNQPEEAADSNKIVHMEVCTGKSDNALTPGRKGFLEL